MQNDKQITMRVPETLYREIEALAADLKLSKSEVMRNALTAGVLEGKQAAKRLRNPAFRMLVKALLAIEGDKDQLDLFEKVLTSTKLNEATT